MCRDNDEWAVVTIGRTVVMGIVVCRTGSEGLGCCILGGELSVASSGEYWSAQLTNIVLEGRRHNEVRG